jgi:hypothetical protein
MKTLRLILLALLLAVPVELALAQEGPMGEAIGEGNEAIGGDNVGGEPTGEGNEDEPIGGEPVQ